MLVRLVLDNDEGQELKGGRKSSFYSQPDLCLLFHDLLRISQFPRVFRVVSIYEPRFVKVKHLVMPQCA